MADFDYICIGGGSGGIASANRAAMYGKKVALVEGAQMGGTCVNVGCIPKKMMHTAALLGEARKDQEAFGWPKFEGKHSWSKMVQGINAKIQSMNRGYESQLKSKLVDYYNALGSFVDKHTISVRHTFTTTNTTTTNTQTRRSRTVTEKKRPRQQDS